MKKPLIGLTPLVDYGRDSLWMLPGYFDGILSAGGIPVMLPLTYAGTDLQQLISTLDGLLITGGQDVSPELYGELPLPVCGEICPERDRLEGPLLDLALDRGLPVLGICRGLQFINVHFGGTLYQDLPSQHPSDICHRQSPPYDLPSHTVTVLTGTPLYELLRTDALPVNSCHHQAVRDLAPSLLPMALSPDGLTEAACLPRHPFLWAVQWHPEFSHAVDENSRKLFRAFVRACGGVSAAAGRFASP